MEGCVDGFVYLRDQEPLSDAELARARAVCGYVSQLLREREGYLTQAGLPPEIFLPSAGWSREAGLFTTTQALLSGERKHLERLRLLSQMFTGYQLLHLRLAQGVPPVTEIPPDHDRTLEGLAATPDLWVARYLQAIRDLPQPFWISPPAKFGEIGWRVQGRIVNHDTTVYLERLALLREAGLLPADGAAADGGAGLGILEIGGGYGGLAYHLRRLLPRARYTIVDLPESLLFAGIYLSVLWPGEADLFLRPGSEEARIRGLEPGVTFAPNFLFPRLRQARPPVHLALNTLSMSEMSEAQVRDYCVGLRELLGERGVFFEQNQDNRTTGMLQASEIIAQYFPHCRPCPGAHPGGLTEGAAHLWSATPLGEGPRLISLPTAPTSAAPTREVAAADPGAGPDAAALFAAGNFAAVAAGGAADDWMTHAARGLIGREAAALAGLGSPEHADARFYAAVACWMAGEEREALTLLDGVPTPYARNLAALIRKPVIRVLAQLPWTRQGAQDLLSGARSEGRFLVQNLSFHPDDLPNQPYGDIHRYYRPEQPPDFYICAMIEWHLVPPNLQELPCPLLGQTADYDLHIQTVHPWLQAFDALVVTDPTEWADVRRLASAPVFTFPKSFVLADDLPPIPTGPRRYDVLQTGTVLHPYYPDKAALFHQLLADPGLHPLFLNGFLGNREYRELLAATKVVPTYVRHSGAMPTRGLEALSMGCAVVAQAGSSLALYAGEEEGVWSYHPARGDLAAVVRRLVDAWPETELAARRGAGVVRREFGLKRVASEYLRFLTFLAARPRPARRRVPTARLDQRRRVLVKGWLPGSATVIQATQEQSVTRLRELAAADPCPRTLNDLARELLLPQALEAAAGSLGEVSCLVSAQLLTFYRNAIDRYPRSIVLRFNYARSAFHLGDPCEVRRALQLAAETLDAPEEEWEITPEEDVFPWDFANTYFDYRAYFDLVTDALAARRDVAGELIRLIRASLAFYLGQYGEEPHRLQTAVRLAPSFPYYRLRYARALLATGGAAERAQARRLLEELAGGSILCVEAGALLEHLFAAEGPAESAPDRERQRARLDRAFLNREPTPVWPLRPAAAAVAVTSNQGVTPAAPAPAPAAPLVSALVTTYRAERFMRGLLEDLEGQTLASRLEIVIVDSHSPEGEGAIVAEFQRRFDNIVYLRTEERENSHVALNRAIRAARGKYLTLANTDDRHRPDALEKLAAFLEARPEVALVYADSAITEEENGTLDSARIVGYLRLPEWDPRRHFRGCGIGPQPMWRRALHGRYGDFDPAYEICGDYELWLRMGVGETFAHLSETLGLYLMSPGSNERVNRIRRHQETERARRKHWPAAWGELPPWDANYNVLQGAAAPAPPGEEGDGPPPAAAGASLPELLRSAADQLAAHRWPQAVAGFREVLRQRPDLAEARAALGSALLVLGRLEEAIPELRAAAEALDSSAAWNDLGWSYAVAERPAEAREAFVRAIQRDPANLEPQWNLAALFETLRMPQEAAAAYDLILLTAPGDPAAQERKRRAAQAAGLAPDTREEAAVTHG